MTTANVTASAAPMGRWQISKSLARSAWHILQCDRSLAWLPVISGMLIFAVLIVVVATILGTSTFTSGIASDGAMIARGPLVEPGPLAIGFYGAILLLITLIGTLFDGALIAGALQRFKGQSPTISSSLAAARKRLGSLVGFGLLSGTIGALLRVGEDRVPIVSQIASWLAGAAWAVASMFAVPVIVSSPTKIGPIAATKRSAGIIKKTWGENIILMGGIGLVAAASILLYIAAVILGIYGGSFILSALGASQPVLASAFEASLFVVMLGFVLLVLGLTVLSAIVKAAIYHYATTDEAPKLFERQVVQASFTDAKARKVFGE